MNVDVLWSSVWPNKALVPTMPARGSFGIRIRHNGLVVVSASCCRSGRWHGRTMQALEAYMMHTILSQLKILQLSMLPPCTHEDIQKLQSVLGRELPQEILLLYQNHGGMTWNTQFPMRLMSPIEVIETHQAFRAISGPAFNEHIGLFWTDDNGNYSGVFMAGKLQGRLCVIDHEEPEDTPQYWSIQSFYEHLLYGYQHHLGWKELSTDYPVIDMKTSYPLKNRDKELGQQYLRLFQEHPDETPCIQYAFYAMNLLPPEETQQLVALLQSSDMWVQERACKNTRNAKICQCHTRFV